MKRTKCPYEKRRQTNSKSSEKIDLFYKNSQRIPVVSRPYIQKEPNQKQESIISIPKADTTSLVTPIPQEILQLTNPTIQDSEKNVSIFVENPFECLASFYFPEHFEGSSNVGSEVTDCLIMDAKTNKIEIQIAKEEFNKQTENTQAVQHKTPVWASGVEQNQLLTKAANISEIVNNVPELVNILQTKSQKKIILEERK